MRLLVVEDRKVMADSIARSLRREGMAVDVAYDGRAALGLAAINSYEVVVLDRDLPGVHGDEVCRQITGGSTRILMLTASATVEDRVDGLSLGADDYLPKPFALSELIARIRALGRRALPAIPPVLAAGDLTLDPNRHLAERAGRPLALTNKEFALLEALMSASGRVLSSEELHERVWDAHADPFSNTLRVTLANLRRKVGDPPLITTVIGAGYKLVIP
jgi:DNA-binding response OmpR family regulator